MDSRAGVDHLRVKKKFLLMSGIDPRLFVCPALGLVTISIELPRFRLMLAVVTIIDFEQVTLNKL
jgi:hypothetical protein